MAGVVTKRTIEKRRRGFFGWFFLLLFWGFNLLMAYAIIVSVGKSPPPAGLTQAQRDAYNAGIGLGVMVSLFFWAAGAVVFGLLAYFSRGKREFIEITEDTPKQ